MQGACAQRREGQLMPGLPRDCLGGGCQHVVARERDAGQGRGESKVGF